MDFSYMLKGEMTVYECSKRSGIAYSTLADLFNGKTPIDRVSMRTAYYTSKTLGITMEEMYEKMHVPERTSFETFKNQVRHEVKDLGDVRFIEKVNTDDSILKYWYLEWFCEAFYLLAMIDYLCRMNNMQIVSKYDNIRQYSLPETVFPVDIKLAAEMSKDLDLRTKAVNESLPEFIRFNIVEKEIRDVY